MPNLARPLDGPVPESEERRAQAAARYVPRGARVLALGAESWAVERHLPGECALIRVERTPCGEGVLVCDFEAGRLPACDWDIVVVLGRLERCPAVEDLLRRLRARGRPVIASYVVAGEGPADRTARGWVNGYTRPELPGLVAGTGFARGVGEELGDGELLLRLDPARLRPRPEKTVWAISCANIGNFGDRLGVHLLAEVLPSNAVLRRLHHFPFELPEGAPDLLVVGIGNSMFHMTLNGDLARLLERAPLAVGIFGTQYREAIPRERLDDVLDRLHLWYARYEADALLYGHGRGNVRHLGDWLIHAFPMSRPTRDEDLQIGPEVAADIPLDRYIAHIQSYRRVVSSRLHPLLCALTSAEEVAYDEQREFPEAGPWESGKFRSMLLDVFGCEMPRNRFWGVDRGSVVAYKERVARNVAQLRADIAGLLG